MWKVTLVINYNLPLKFNTDPNNRERAVDLETYLHRVGRTGWFGDKGIAINFIHESKDISLISTIEEHYENKIELLNINDLDKVNNELL